MTIGQIFSILQFGLIVKLFFSVLLLFYFIFAVVVYRQVSLMTQVLNSNVSSLVKMVALGQIVLVATMFFLGVILV